MPQEVVPEIRTGGLLRACFTLSAARPFAGAGAGEQDVTAQAVSRPVALAVLRGDKTLTEITAQDEVHPKQVIDN
jgi:hypothetical protein